MKTSIKLLAALAIMPCVTLAEPQMERLSRGIVGVPAAGGGHFISWRLLGTDAESLAFNLYQQTGKQAAVRLNRSPISGATNYLVGEDVADDSAEYFIRPIIGREEGMPSSSVTIWRDGYLEIPIKLLDGYWPGDASLGDLDGDGDYEIILQQSGRARDNSHSGLTDNPVLDAYELDGTHLWRIDLGKNIRDGEHYTQFMVYDLDGDGRAEVACKTADGSRDGRGKVIGDPTRDWRELDESSKSFGRILGGPEFLTVFDGSTGGVLQTVDFVPGRDPTDGWGGIGGNSNNDDYGNRCDRFLACVAYLDGEQPSLVMSRGVYGRTVLVAWDWRDGGLSKRWTFDSGIAYRPYRDASPYSGMGGHSLGVADVDADGRDEIVYQAMVVDDDGKGLHTSGLRHGDAMHVSDFDPARPGLEIFTVQENEGGPYAEMTPGAALRDAETGEILWSHSLGVDVSMGMAADIDPRHPGAEMWGGPGGLRTVGGEVIGRAPRTSGFAIWWDGDPLRELLTSSRVTKWDWQEERERELLRLRENGSRRGRNPALVGDLVGDWREEVIVPAADGRSLRLYSTPIPTDHRLTTLMHDRQYRLAIAWQNVVYNKPPHPSFFLGHGFQSPGPRREGDQEFDFQSREFGSYSESLGYGWEPGSRRFSVRVPEGNHRVTVRLGNADTAATTTIKAELRRLMVEEESTGEGESEELSFIVNTRQPAFGDGREVRLKDRERRGESIAWDDKLTLEFIESAPALQWLKIEAVVQVPTIFLLGDSTVCDQPLEPYASWGQMLTRFFSSGVAIANHGESGESYSASLGRGRIDKIADVMRPGDYLFLQFAHNDMKERGEGKGAFLNFKEGMRKHIVAARASGGIPVLVTPVHRRRFDGDGKVTNSFGDYPEAVRQVAAEEGVPLIDLLSRSAELYESLGPNGSGILFKDGDGTHHNNYGAYQLAKCVVAEIAVKLPAVAAWLRGGVVAYDPARPDPIEQFILPASDQSARSAPDGN